MQQLLPKMLHKAMYCLIGAVQALLQRPALLAMQVMGWCARRGLQDQPHTGRFASVPDWMRQVHRRRDQAPPGWTLFLDDVLQVPEVPASAC